MSKSQTGKKRSSDICQKMSERQTGNKHWLFGKRHKDTTIQKMRDIKVGKKFTVEHRQKISHAQLGRVVSDSTRQKISMSNKGKQSAPKSEETRRRMVESWKTRRKPIICI